MSDTKQIDQIESPSRSRNRQIADAIKRNRARATVLAVLVFLFIAGMAGIEPSKWFSTIMQGLSVGALVFLVASGFQLIFGLMDVLNLAHGELFMLGAYVGWTVYTRFDTFIDVLIPLLIVAAPFALMPVWRPIGRKIGAVARWGRVAAWGLIVVGRRPDRRRHHQVPAGHLECRGLRQDPGEHVGPGRSRHAGAAARPTASGGRSSLRCWPCCSEVPLLALGLSTP